MTKMTHGVGRGVDAIETDDATPRSMPTAQGDPHHLGQGLAQHWRFMQLLGAETNGAITSQFRSQKAATLSPFSFLCPLKPMLECRHRKASQLVINIRLP